MDGGADPTHLRPRGKGALQSHMYNTGGIWRFPDRGESKTCEKQADCDDLKIS